MAYGELFGGYNVNNEASGIARGFIDDVGVRVSNGHSLSNYDYRVMDVDINKGAGELSSRMQGSWYWLDKNIPKYDISRHDFS